MKRDIPFSWDLKCLEAHEVFLTNWKLRADFGAKFSVEFSILYLPLTMFALIECF